MYKEATYKQKISDLQEWVPFIIETVKKDLKNDHLKKDFYFTKKFFPAKNINKITIDEMTEAYLKAIEEEEKGEEIAEFIASRWLLNNSELYEFFEQQLTQLCPDFTALTELDPLQAETLIAASNRQFGAPHTYLFSVLNSVVLPKESFQSLRKEAKQTKEEKEVEAKQVEEQLTVDNLQKGFDREIARLTDKYEKKLSGLQKKYLQDTERLKKENAQLQRRLSTK